MSQASTVTAPTVTTPTAAAPTAQAAKTPCGEGSPFAYFNVGMAYRGTPGKRTIIGWNDPQSYTPDIMPDFCMADGITPDVISWFAWMEEPLYISGPTGCGKTTAVKQVAARCNWPVYEVTGHARLEMPDLIGHLSMREGSMYYEYGPLSLAMRYGGIFLFNEMDLCDPSLLAALNTVLDGAPLCIAEHGGEIIKPHQLFRFVATANSAGCGDESGLYQGVLRQNLALMDRFLVLKATYLPAATEVELVKRAAPTLGDDVVGKYVDFANAVREAFVGSAEVGASVSVTLSTRTLLRWARLSVTFAELANSGITVPYYALERALLNRADEGTFETLREIYQRVFGSVPNRS